VVVGAYQEDSNATGVNGNQSCNSAFQSGAAYVFVRNAGVWTQQAYLKTSNTEGRAVVSAILCKRRSVEQPFTAVELPGFDLPTGW